MRAQVAMLVALAIAACGDDEGGRPPVDAAVIADVGSLLPDASTADAAPPPPDARPRTDATITDAAPLDAGGLPDLIVTKIERDAFYRVTFCNLAAASSQTFRLRLIHGSTAASFDTAPTLTVPAPNTCTTSGGISCGLIGDPTCTAPSATAIADPTNLVDETDETNNDLEVVF